MKKYQELEDKIVELRQEADRLQKEVDRLKKEEKQNKLPKDFNRGACIKFLKTFRSSDLFSSFTWKDTPQGEDYWDKIHEELDWSAYYKVPQEAINYIQSLVIKSYQQEFESK